MFCLISLHILQNALFESALSWGFSHVYLLWRTYSDAAHGLYLRLYWYVCSSHSGVCIVIFVYVIQSNCCLYFILGNLSYDSPMYGLVFHCIFVKFKFSLIFLLMLYLCFLWCTSYDLFLGCATFWDSCHAHFLYIICYASFIIFVDLHSQ